MLDPSVQSARETGRSWPDSVSSPLHVAALGAILLIAAAARFTKLGTGFDLDEAYSVEIAKHSVSGIVSLIESTDTHPPLSYLGLHFWIAAFGTSEIAVRSLAAAWSLGTVLVIYLIGRSAWSPRVGLLAALLLALSQYNVMLGQYARMYSMMGFFAALSLYYLWRVYETRSRRHALLYLAASAVLIYAHVWGVFFVLAQSVAVLVLVAARRISTVLLGRWLLLQACLVAIWTPWLVTGFTHQVRVTLRDDKLLSGNLAGKVPPDVHTVANAAYVAANTHTLALLFVAIAGGTVTAAVLGSGSPRHARPVRRLLSEGIDDPRLVMLAACYLMPLAVGVVASYAIVPIFQQRYVIATTLPVYLIVAVAITRLPTRLLGGVAALAVVVLAGWNVASYLDRRSDLFRAPALYIRTHARANDVVLYDMQPIVFDYYVHRSDIHGTEIRLHQELARSFATLIRGKSDAVDTALRDPHAKDSTQLDLQVLRAASRYPRVWLVLGPQFPGQLRESTAVGTLRRAFGRPRVTAVVGRYHIFLFAR